MPDLQALLSAFHDATTREAAVWVSKDGVAAPRLAGVAPRDSGLASWQPAFDSGPPVPVDGPGGRRVLLGCVPGPSHAWAALSPTNEDAAPLDPALAFLLAAISQFLQSTIEVEHVTNELADRYEEINLLYTITEILGRTVSLEEAAATILREISETVGARRGSILVHDRVTDTLQSVAALGVATFDVLPISVDDECSVSARVFRDQRATVAEGDSFPCPQESVYRRGTMFSVPIMWTAPSGGARPLGVVNLSDRRNGQPFSAGDRKLITAIATQIGTAIENARLVRASLSQQRLVQELELAHDLQMMLLPSTMVVAPEAEVAASVIPAESVGGDFYNLFRLDASRTGVMIGDVSSHGYRAALIMALAMSASAIHAQTLRDPGDVLAALLSTLRDELVSTEMFITAFYAVIDRDNGTLRYANTGHPHAYVISADGNVTRLGALDPPLGMVERRPSALSRPWASGRDVLVLFTDGVSDARNRAGARLGERPVLETMVRHRRDAPDVILKRTLAELADYTGNAVQRDDLALLILRC